MTEQRPKTENWRYKYDLSSQSITTLELFKGYISMLREMKIDKLGIYEVTQLFDQINEVIDMTFKMSEQIEKWMIDLDPERYGGEYD